MGSRHYCAPELRDGRVQVDVPMELADVYSLGKLLYWMFTKRVFDREETYSNNHLAIRLANSDTVVRPVQSIMAAAIVDDLVAESVVGDPSRRVTRAAKQLRAKVERAIDRIKAVGRPIDLSLPKRCLFCGEGEYLPLHERTERPVYGPPFPSREKRKGSNPNPQVIGQSPGPYDRLTSAADAFVTHDTRGWPLYLVCDYCGNVQYFRLDLTKDKRGENWKP